MEHCATCRYYIPDPPPQHYGICARFPRREFGKHEQDGCGEHKPIEAVKIKEPKR